MERKEIMSKSSGNKSEMFKVKNELQKNSENDVTKEHGDKKFLTLDNSEEQSDVEAKSSEAKDLDSEKEGVSSALPAPKPETTLDNYMAQISRYPLLSREEEYELAKQYKEKGDLDAARKLVTSNLRFVVKVAMEFKNYGLNMMDLIQEGNIGLMQAVKRFDPDKGYRLITYAVWWIKARIKNYVMKTWSLVKIGTTQAQRKLFYKLRSTKNELDIGGEVVTPEEYEELAEELEVSEESARNMDQRMSSKDMSLDAELGDEGDTTHLDMLEHDVPDQEEVLAKAEEEARIKDKLANVLEMLDERERYIIENRILRENTITLRELGEEFDLSKERIRQIESAALDKMRSALKEEGVDEIDLYID